MRFILPFVLSILVIVVGGIFYFNRSDNNDTSSSTANKTISQTVKERPKAIVYKSPTCGCCKLYITYLKKQGFDVEIKDVTDTESIKNKYNISSDKVSCHTTIVDDYFFEGHIPVEAINKVLKEKPEIQGIALPGMPSGSPGMSGEKFDKFEISQLSKDSTWSNYLSI